MELLARVLLTYLVHSTLLLGAAAIVRGLLRERRLALQEAVLRAALVGGMATTALQVGFALQPMAGTWRVPDLSASAPLSAGPPAIAVAGPTATSTEVSGSPRAVRGAAGANHQAAVPQDTVRGVAGFLLSQTEQTAWGWRWVLVVVWGALSAIALCRLGVAMLRLRGLLRGRFAIEAGELVWHAHRVAGALGLRRLRLAAAPRLAVPIAKGILRPEVCLPGRAVSEMGRDEQVALCAHELAHLARRDPAWILLARAVATIAPLQPLNLWASRRLQDLAECLSDDLAVSASVRPAGLARSLVDVASWTIGERAILPATAAGAWSARSRLGYRVERLMDRHRILERPRRVFLPLAAAAVLATALVAPVVSDDATPVSPPEPTTPAVAPVAPSEPSAALEARPVIAPEMPPAPEVPSAEVPAPVAAPAPVLAPRPAAVPVPLPEASPLRPATAAEPMLAPVSEVEAADRRRADFERQLRRLNERIEERVRRNQLAMQKLEQQLEILVERLQRNEAELHAKARTLAEQARPTNQELHEMQRLAREAARAARQDARERAHAMQEALAKAGAQEHEALERAREAVLRAEDALQLAHERLRRAEEDALRRSEERRKQGEKP